MKTACFAILSLLMIKPGQLCSQNKSFISFDVQPGKNNTVIIQWKVQPGAGSFDYTVQKSSDKTTWETIPMAESGLSQNYSCIDSRPVEGINYYRIRHNTTNKEFSFSEIKWIQIGDAGKFYLWPNPANDVLHVKSLFLKGSIDILDAQGKFIRKIVITNFVTDIPITTLQKGKYFLHIHHGNEILVQKFVKD